MIRHHPDDATLMAHATGTLASGAELLAAVHLEGCAHCKAVAREFELVAATILTDQLPAELAPDSFDRLMARIDAKPAPHAAFRVGSRPRLPAGMDWPRSLRHCHISRWHVMGPGMKWSRVRLPYDPTENLVLLRIAAGKCLPPHTHSGVELTQVLYGAFDDGRAVFSAGDFDSTDGSVYHQPVVQASGECICLAALTGRLMFDSRLARLAGALVGL